MRVDGSRSDGRLSICPKTYQQQVLRIKAQLDLYNSETVFLMRQFELTFSAISSENHEQIRKNLRAGYSKLGRMAMNIADLIGQLDRTRTA